MSEPLLAFAAITIVLMVFAFLQNFWKPVVTSLFPLIHPSVQILLLWTDGNMNMMIPMYLGGFRGDCWLYD